MVLVNCSSFCVRVFVGWFGIPDGKKGLIRVFSIGLDGNADHRNGVLVGYAVCSDNYFLTFKINYRVVGKTMVVYFSYYGSGFVGGLVSYRLYLFGTN